MYQKLVSGFFGPLLSLFRLLPESWGDYVNQATDV